MNVKTTNNTNLIIKLIYIDNFLQKGIIIDNMTILK